VPKNVIHISEAEAASDFARLMARVCAGAEVIIENGKRPAAILHEAACALRPGSWKPSFVCWTPWQETRFDHPLRVNQ
jgi:antitoxin (DNA-binding transcriptional repressor) of toxin-antitoxin stability system